MNRYIAFIAWLIIQNIYGENNSIYLVMYNIVFFFFNEINFSL